MALDNLNIVYTINIKKSEVRIVKILYVDNTKIGSQSQPHEKLRTKEWLEKINEMMEFRGDKFEEEKS